MLQVVFYWILLFCCPGLIYRKLVDGNGCNCKGQEYHSPEFNPLFSLGGLLVFLFADGNLLGCIFVAILRKRFELLSGLLDLRGFSAFEQRGGSAIQPLITMLYEKLLWRGVL